MRFKPMLLTKISPWNAQIMQ